MVAPNNIVKWCKSKHQFFKDRNYFVLLFETCPTIKLLPDGTSGGGQRTHKVANVGNVYGQGGNLGLDGLDRWFRHVPWLLLVIGEGCECDLNTGAGKPQTTPEKKSHNDNVDIRLNALILPGNKQVKEVWEVGIDAAEGSRPLATTNSLNMDHWRDDYVTLRVFIYYSCSIFGPAADRVKVFYYQRHGCNIRCHVSPQWS